MNVIIAVIGSLVFLSAISSVVCMLVAWIALSHRDYRVFHKFDGFVMYSFATSIILLLLMGVVGMILEIK